MPVFAFANTDGTTDTVVSENADAAVHKKLTQLGWTWSLVRFQFYKEDDPRQIFLARADAREILIAAIKKIEDLSFDNLFELATALQPMPHFEGYLSQEVGKNNILEIASFMYNWIGRWKYDVGQQVESGYATIIPEYHKADDLTTAEFLKRDFPEPIWKDGLTVTLTPGTSAYVVPRAFLAAVLRTIVWMVEQYQQIPDAERFASANSQKS